MEYTVRESGISQKRSFSSDAPKGRSKPGSPTAGNPEGDVTVIEFFDYRCPYCKRVVEPLLQAVVDDGQVRIVFKEYPIRDYPLDLCTCRAYIKG